MGNNIKIKTINFDSLKNFDNHLVVSYFSERSIGLEGFICIHNLNLGPALGGTRYWSYPSLQEALEDCLKLSRTMTYKCALAGLKAGGGKAVIIKNYKTEKNIFKVLEKYAEIVNVFNGSFYTGEDVGMKEEYVKFLSKKSKFILGLNKNFSTSYTTALGVFYAIKASLKHVFGDDIIRGHSFAIKGLGKVGFELAKLLIKNGGKVIGSDTNKKIIEKVKKELPQISLVEPNVIHKQKVDVYSPCAVGNDISYKNLSELNCKIICGGANNQLQNEKLGYLLFKRKIIYIPDYLANSGGVINVFEELNHKSYSVKRIIRNIKKIYKTTLYVLDLSKKYKKPTNIISDGLTKLIIDKKLNNSNFFKFFKVNYENKKILKFQW